MNNSAIHLTNVRGQWFWSITEAGAALVAGGAGFRSANEAQAEARAMLCKYRKLAQMFS